jgi:tetratricopeptide (TPR) repeat protein
MPGDRRAQPTGSGSLHAVAEDAARRIAERTVPAAARHPTAQELREVGARDAEAWRQFRRARRAARMEQWPRVRALAGDAIALDPDFCMAWLELALTQNAEDGARRPFLDKVVALGDRAQGLSPLSRLGVEFARRSLAGDGRGLGRVLESLAALKLEGQDLLYVRTRLALAPFQQHEPERGLPLLERIREEWPQDAAAPKKLAEYHLGRIDRASPPLAVRYGRMAVSLAPEDVAARATLARALLLAGDQAGAQEHAAVLAMADPDQKQGALLFALHMSLGDVEEATADARRLLLDPDTAGQGQAELATIALARGDFEGGLAGLGAAAAEYDRLQGEALALMLRWQHAWQSYALDRPVHTASAPADSLSDKYARCIAIVHTLSRMRSGTASTGPAAIASLRREIARLPADGDWQLERATFELLIRYTRRDWAGVVAAYRDIEGRTVPLGTAYYAASALERLGRRDEAVRVYELLATHPDAWRQSYRRGQAWLRLGILRQQAGDVVGCRHAYKSLLRLWDRAPRETPEIREAERRLAELGRP